MWLVQYPLLPSRECPEWEVSAGEGDEIIVAEYKMYLFFYFFVVITCL